MGHGMIWSAAIRRNGMTIRGLSLGLRWEYAQPYVNTKDRISIFDPAFPGG
jgi:hypothetical protein